MTSRWYVIQIKRAHDRSAAAEVVARGYPTYLAMTTKRRHHNHRIETVLVPRFHPYLFARFDIQRDAWPDLMHDDAGKRAGIVKVLADIDGKPVPVPDRAMEAIWKYIPRPDVARLPQVYTSGEPVKVYQGGVPIHAVFVGYERGRAMVRLWIFGRETLSVVETGTLEPYLDNEDNLHIMRA